MQQNGTPDRKPSPMTDATTGDPPVYNALAQAKELLRSVRAGALATLVPGNAFPFASLVNVATTPDGSPILLLSHLAVHTRHLACRSPPFAPPCANRRGRSPRASARHDHGKGRMCHRPGRPRGAEGALLGQASGIGALCRFRRLCILAGGHGTSAFERRVCARRTLQGGVSRHIARRRGSLGRGRGASGCRIERHHRDALARLATGIAGKPDGPWQATGIDPDGIDLGCGDRTARIAFPRPVRGLDEPPRDIAATHRGRAASRERPSTGRLRERCRAKLGCFLRSSRTAKCRILNLEFRASAASGGSKLQEGK